MSKLLEATCSASGEVKVGDAIVSNAEVLSAGKQASSGLLILDRDKAWYIALNTTDLATTIDKTAQALTQTATALTSAGPTLDSLVPGSGAPLTSAATQINALVSELNQLKGALK